MSPPPDAGRPDPLVLAAELLLRCGRPGAVAGLVRDHVPDASGHCRGCPSSTAPVHPCRLRLIGDIARRLDRPARTDDDT